MRCQMAECARKVILAADALDEYAAAVGTCPCGGDRRGPRGDVMDALAAFNIDWWNDSTELGGDWSWFCGSDDWAIAISNPKVSDRRMRQFDQLIDDGDLSAGMFRRYGSIYCYVLTQKGRV